MFNLPDYFRMLEEKQARRRFKAPLVSWDVLMFRHHNETEIASDVCRLQKLSDEAGWAQVWNINEKLHRDEVVLVTDPSLRIVFASYNLFKTTGYTTEEVKGCSVEMLREQGITEEEIRIKIEAKEPFVLTRFRKDGSVYRSRIEAYPVFDLQQNLVHFILFEKEVGEIND